MKVVKGWTEAYTVEFSGSSGKGDRPLVVSYNTSPAYEPATEALTRTCFRQVEYAGVLAGAQNEVGARKFVDFMLSAKVQAEIPEQMYMNPVDADGEAARPTGSQHAAVVADPIQVLDRRPRRRPRHLDQGLDGRGHRVSMTEPGPAVLSRSRWTELGTVPDPVRAGWGDARSCGCWPRRCRWPSLACSSRGR